MPDENRPQILHPIIALSAGLLAESISTFSDNDEERDVETFRPTSFSQGTGKKVKRGDLQGMSDFVTTSWQGLLVSDTVVSLQELVVTLTDVPSSAEWGRWGLPRYFLRL